ncbi:hypothetical protein LguiB_026775 [Lonicera macranthoides]
MTSSDDDEINPPPLDVLEIAPNVLEVAPLNAHITLTLEVTWTTRRDSMPNIMYNVIYMKKKFGTFRALRIGTNVPINLPAVVQLAPMSSEAEEDSKKGQIRWQKDMDDVLITTLVDHVHEKCDVAVAEKNVRFRLKTFKKERIELHTLFQISEFGWDENTGQITADPSVWDKYTKANPNLSKLRGNVCPYYLELEIIFGSDTATRDRAVSGHDIPQMSVCHKRRRLKSRHKREHLTEEDIAFSVITESSKQIAKAIKTYTSQKKIDRQSVIEKLQDVGISNSDVIKVMELLEKDKDLADAFLSITNERFRRSWVYNKLGQVPPNVPR